MQKKKSRGSDRQGSKVSAKLVRKSKINKRLAAGVMSGTMRVAAARAKAGGDIDSDAFWTRAGAVASEVYDSYVNLFDGGVPHPPANDE